eukprot:1481_1
MAYTHIEKEEKKYDYGIDFEDQEMLVHDSDLREKIYESIHKNEHIIKCVGQLRIVYKYKQFSYNLTTLGTATVCVVNQNRAYLLTCAHNARRMIFECENCRKYMERIHNNSLISKCIHCSTAKLQKKMIKATEIQFKRRCIKKEILKQTENDDEQEIIKFGDMIKSYNCKCEYIDDYNYNLYPYTASGYDIAILSFKDTDNYYAQYTTNIIVGHGPKLVTNKCSVFNIFGYPGDKIDKMYGMQSTGNHYKLQTHSKSGNVYLQQREIDTAKGQSGSAVWFKLQNSSKVVIFGVHSGGSRKYKYNTCTLVDTNIISKLAVYAGENTKFQICRGMCNLITCCSCVSLSHLKGKNVISIKCNNAVEYVPYTAEQRLYEVKTLIEDALNKLGLENITKKNFRWKLNENVLCYYIPIKQIDCNVEYMLDESVAVFINSKFSSEIDKIIKNTDESKIDWDMFKHFMQYHHFYRNDNFISIIGAYFKELPSDTLLSFNGKQFDFRNTPNDIGLKDNDMILTDNKQYEKQQNTELFCKTIYGKYLKLKVNLEEYLGLDLKCLLQKMDVGLCLKYPAHQQKLVFCGKEIQDGMILKDVGLKDGDTIQMLPRLRGSTACSHADHCD